MRERRHPATDRGLIEDLIKLMNILGEEKVYNVYQITIFLKEIIFNSPNGPAVYTTKGKYHICILYFLSIWN